MSFWKRLILSAQSLPARADEEQPFRQDDGTPAGDEVPGSSAPQELQEENTG